MKINRLNGPSPIGDTSTWLNQRTCLLLIGYARKSPLKVLQNRLSAITISSQQVLISKPDACANVTFCCCRAGGRTVT